MQIPLVNGPDPAAVGGQYNRLYLWGACLAAALGGLMFGYDWVVISGADIFYEKYFDITSASDIGWAKGCALAGCLGGALVSGALSDRFGRKRLLILAAVLFVVSSLATGLADTFTQFVLWRIVGGVAIGIASNLSPMYIAEIAPAAIRGKLVSLNQFNIVTGIVLAQVVNWLVARPVAADASALEILNSWNGQYGWRWMFCLVAVPAVLFLVGLLFVPESPRWLVKNGQRDKARRILSRLGGEEFATQSVGGHRVHAGRRDPQGELPRFVRAGRAPHRRFRRVAGIHRAMVRHQRDFLLHQGRVRRGRLQCLRHSAEHHHRRRDQSGLHLRRPANRGPPGAAAR